MQLLIRIYYHCLVVHELPHCSMWRSFQHASFARCHFVLSVWKWGAKNVTNMLQIYPWTTCKKFQKPFVSSICRFIEVRPVRWPRSGQSMDFLNNREIPDHLNQGVFSFVKIIFVWSFLKDADFVMFSVIFFSIKFEYISWNY